MLWFVICGGLNLVCYLLLVFDCLFVFCWLFCSAFTDVVVLGFCFCGYVDCLFDVVGWFLCGYCVVYSCVFAGSAFTELVVLLFVIDLV